MSILEYILTAICLLFALGLILLRKKLIQCRQKIASLIKKLQEEHKKRIFPLLELRLDEDQYAFFLKNVSETPAFGIVFDQVPVTLESGFERTFGFQFDPVENLKPNDEIRLNYNLYFESEKEPDHFKKSLFTNVSFSKIRFRLKYLNIHHMPFKMQVQKTRTHFQLIDAGPLEENDLTQYPE